MRQAREPSTWPHLQLCWTKAHRTAQQVGAEVSDRLDYLGNKEADRVAGFASETHAPMKHQLAVFQQRRDLAKAHLAETVRALRAYGDEVCHPRGGGRALAVKQAAARSRHRFAPVSLKKWVCLDCFASRRVSPYRAGGRIGRCPGQDGPLHSLLRVAAAMRPAHKLHVGFVGGDLSRPVAFCSTGWMYTSGRRGKLTKPCEGPKKSPAQKALQQARHPASKEPIVRIRPLELEILGLGSGQHIEVESQQLGSHSAAPVLLADAPQFAPHFDDSQADRLSLSDCTADGRDEEPADSEHVL